MNHEAKPKITLAMQDVKVGHGLVYVCGPSMPIDNESLSKLKAVGTWSTHDGMVILALTTTIEAQQDVLIQSMEKIRLARIEEFGRADVLFRVHPRIDTSGVREKRTRTRTRREPDPPPVSLNYLRDKLRRRQIGSWA